jgi:hypothetical protein
MIGTGTFCGGARMLEQRFRSTDDASRKRDRADEEITIVNKGISQLGEIRPTCLISTLLTKQTTKRVLTSTKAVRYLVSTHLPWNVHDLRSGQQPLSPIITILETVGCVYNKTRHEEVDIKFRDALLSPVYSRRPRNTSILWLSTRLEGFLAGAVIILFPCYAMGPCQVPKPSMLLLDGPENLAIPSRIACSPFSPFLVCFFYQFSGIVISGTSSL